MKKILLSGLSFIALNAGFAHAATATTTFLAKVVIAGACSVTATNLDFGTQGIIAANVDMTSAISVTCTNTTPYAVGLNSGTYGTAVNARKMKISAAGVNAVSYSMFRDSARILNWGNTVAIDTLAGVGTGLAQSLTVYGRVPAQAAVAPGTYTDTVSVTVTY
jgi:spore coat protein U-like protein